MNYPYLIKHTESTNILSEKKIVQTLLIHFNIFTFLRPRLPMTKVNY